MFEQLYGHDTVILQLQKDIERDHLPSALLMYGKQYTGRMTTALEVARALSCDRVGIGSCDCPRCRQQSTLHDPYLMILAKRNHIPEIEAAFATVKYAKNFASRQLFIRSVMVLLGQFQPVFIEAAAPAKKGLFEQASDVDDLLHQLLGMNMGEEPDATDKLLESIMKKVRKIAAGVHASIPVSYIRNISVWLRSTSENIRRIVIIEGVDEFHDSAINSMLKILEEPPKNVFFILLAKKKNTIIPTILSRVRSYYLGDRKGAEEQVIERVFLDKADEFDSLQTFFTTKMGVDCRELRDSAESYLFTALERRITPRSEIEQIISTISQKKQMSLFLKELTDILEEEVTDRLLTDEQAYEILNMVSDMHQKSVIYHQGDALLLETLYYRIADIV